MARQTLTKFVKTGNEPSLQTEDPQLREPRPCFVTLREEGKLRGCVGSLRAQRPLYEEVARMTRAAASEDFRFSSVQPEELGRIKIEISVLSPLERIGSPAEIEVGRHGIYLRWRDRSGAFLPEVAREMNWTAEEFVRSCALDKAQIPEDALPEAEFYRFTTEKILEHV